MTDKSISHESMTRPVTSSTRQESPSAPGVRGSSMLRSRTFWIALAAVALAIGVALNWSWLVALGLAPLLIAVLPCAAMCVLGLCMVKKKRPD